MAIFKGAGVAIVTPMKDNEDVNYDKLEELINWHVDNGTDSIIIAGTTGESSTLTMQEHKEVIEAAVKFTNHRIPVVAGTGSNCTRTAIQLSQEAEEAGADGLLIVTPYYNKATQAGLIKHYSAIADNTKLPIIMYNVPGRTGCNLMPETVATLFKTKENIVGLKEATGNMAQASETMYLTDG
jgi:4-hydroxy-tetrahydrodipicolinate synthase